MSDDLVRPIRPPQGPFFIDEDGDIADADDWLVCCPARDVWEDDQAHAQWVLKAFEAADRVTALEAELREARMQVLASDGQAAEAHAAQLKATAERDALAEKLERAVEALKAIGNQDEGWLNRKRSSALARATIAALEDKKDG